MYLILDAVTLRVPEARQLIHMIPPTFRTLPPVVNKRIVSPLNLKSSTPSPLLLPNIGHMKLNFNDAEIHCNMKSTYVN